MGYIEQNLVPGETVLYKTRLHWIVMIGPLLAGLLLEGIGIALIVTRRQNNLEDASNTALRVGGSALLVVAAVLVAVGIIRRTSTEVAVSNKRVPIKTGVAARKSIEVSKEGWMSPVAPENPAGIRLSCYPAEREISL